MNQLQAMRVFMRVVELASFSAAARQLGMSGAAVSRSVMTLEAHLNLRLINRSTRHLSLTDAGQRYMEGCKEVIDRLDTMEASLVRSTRDLNGILRVSTPSTFAVSGLCSLLAAYRNAHPKVSFEVTTTDAAVSLIEGGFDVGFSDAPHMPDSTLVSRQLRSFKRIVVASPRYLQKHGTPATPAELSLHHLLTTTHSADKAWRFTVEGEVMRIPTSAALQASCHATVHSAALANMGIAILPAPLVEHDLARGHLLPILSQYEIVDGHRQVSILYTSRTYLSARVRHFIEFVVDQYRPAYPPPVMREAA
ncbi:LysR family transcriptional regulator [Caballeronia sp. LZ035]|uniref:LysR family transcriptional regulator n=1 Tax=Caballeronia sp. LZ035 TaxID=3038568 RepID=UPI0028599BB8|nr:LysR family transcriptional regulator [Caballeronia sp. LZ035]MDR5755384.1 LysR family transcriptional regulator [Caballeronia sp. LZ035]